MSPSVEVLVQVYLLALVLNTGIAALVWRLGKLPLFRTLMWIWICLLLSMLVQGWAARGSDLAIALGVSSTMPAFYLVSNLMLRVIGCPEIRVRVAVIALLLSLLGGVVLHALGFPFVVYAYPCVLGMVAVAFGAALRAVRSGQLRGRPLAGFMVVSAVLFSGHLLDFPFLRPDPLMATFGYTVVLLLAQLFSIAAPLAIAENALSQRDEFISVASHELRTPITALSLQIQSAARTLQRGGQADDNRIPTLQAADRQLRRLDHLIENLLSAGAIAGAGLALRREDLNLYALVERTLGDVAAASGAAAAAQLRISGDRAARASVDRLRIEQVVSNLLGNAIKFGDGKPIDVEVRAERGSAVIVVRDQGVGVDPAVMPRLFRAYSRGHGGSSGMGLGLHVSKQIVDAHGGEIRVTSQPGAGSEFYVKLPG